MGTIERSIDIERPADAVWAVLEDVRRLPEFSPSTTAVLEAPERLTEPGQRFRQEVRQLGRRFESDWRVLEIEPGRRLVIEGSVGYGVRYRLHERLEPTGSSRCRMRLCVEYKLPLGALGKVASKLGVERLAEHEAGLVLDGLKSLVERDASRAA
jgi:uncharacterized membrane protein